MEQPLWQTPDMPKKSKPKKKRKPIRTPKPDANQTAFRVLNEATRDK
jgi:hypothetical protein